MWRELRGHSSVVRPKVVPDSSAMDALEQKVASLSYRPSNGFHKELLQRRITEVTLKVRWVLS